MNEQHGRCLAHSRCSGNVPVALPPLPVTGCRPAAPGWLPEFQFFVYSYRLGESTLNPKFPASFENS